MKSMEIVQQIKNGVFVFLSLPRFASVFALLHEGTLGANSTLLHFSVVTQCF